MNDYDRWWWFYAEISIHEYSAKMFFRARRKDLYCCESVDEGACRSPSITCISIFFWKLGWLVYYASRRKMTLYSFDKEKWKFFLFTLFSFCRPRNIRQKSIHISVLECWLVCFSYSIPPVSGPKKFFEKAKRKRTQGNWRLWWNKRGEEKLPRLLRNGLCMSTTSCR